MPAATASLPPSLRPAAPGPALPQPAPRPAGAVAASLLQICPAPRAAGRLPCVAAAGAAPPGRKRAGPASLSRPSTIVRVVPQRAAWRRADGNLCGILRLPCYRQSGAKTLEPGEPPEAQFRQSTDRARGTTSTFPKRGLQLAAEATFSDSLWAVFCRTGCGNRWSIAGRALAAPDIPWCRCSFRPRSP